jgi:peptidylprolyl isomerase
MICRLMANLPNAPVRTNHHRQKRNEKSFGGPMKKVLLITTALTALVATVLNSSAAPASGMCAKPPKAATGLTDAKVTKLVKTDFVVGKGASAVAGKMVKVNYIGKLVNGKQFDASCDRGEPFVFALGKGQVIKGWDQGVAGMKVGGIRRLVIPASLGYGAAGAGSDIPGGAALVFDVELLEVK